VPVLWILLGVALGGLAAIPIVGRLMRRAESRARHAERRARESERLAELGSMTGGLAHEIKNPLSTIGLNAQLLAEGLQDAQIPVGERDRLLRRLDALGREAERLRGILTDFLQFAGRMNLDPQAHDLGELLGELSDFFHPQCDQAGVVLRTQQPPEPVIAWVDAGLFKQALLNLMINAVQAMPARGEDGTAGELILRLDSDTAEARIHVTDTGPGIDADTVERIFHPYVSSKSGGTGLGLPTARRIIEEHGGHLEAHTAPGQGCDFVIHIPLGKPVTQPE